MLYIITVSHIIHTYSYYQLYFSCIAHTNYLVVLKTKTTTYYYYILHYYYVHYYLHFLFSFSNQISLIQKISKQKITKTNGLTGFKHKLTILESILTLLLLAVHFISLKLHVYSVFQMFCATARKFSRGGSKKKNFPPPYPQNALIV